MLTAKECLQSAEVCLALAHKTKELDTRAALLEFAYEFRTMAKRLERDERKLMVRAASPIHGECASRQARAASDGTQEHKFPRIDAVSETGAIVYRHFFLPYSSSSSRFTAGAAEFFILSQSAAGLATSLDSQR
jgi:hypothetical protein